MNYLFILASIGFFLWIIRNTLLWVELWQSKEYRLDRLSVHLQETRQGKQLFFSPIRIFSWVLLGWFAIFPSGWNGIVVMLLYLYAGAQVLFEAASRYKLRRPVRTIKALTITFLSIISIVALYFFSGSDSLIGLLLLDNMLILIIAFFVLLFAIPTQFFLHYKILKAKEIIKKHKKLFVIAVSGSYGKSSTKEYIAQVLAEKYTVVKTLGSNNTPIGIANTILSQITDNTDVFVVEMGAYKKGEIAELCAIVQPQISITTSVSDQHLSLFGSLENAIETEEELINALPENGLALFNGNNENTRTLYEKTKKKKVLYTVNGNGEIVATDVIQEKDGISFSVFLGKKTIDFKTPLIGIHMVENVLPAIFIAQHLGVSVSLIKKAVANLTPPPKTMTRKILPNSVVLIDDTFNASPESVQAAITYMKVYDKKKILVVMPLVELGKHAQQRHYEIGKAAAHVCDYVFVTNTNFYQQMKQGITDQKGSCQLIYKKIPEIVEEIITIAKKDDVIVFEGKEAGKVLQGLL